MGGYAGVTTSTRLVGTKTLTRSGYCRTYRLPTSLWLGRSTSTSSVSDRGRIGAAFWDSCLVRIHFDLPGWQGRQIGMLLISPYHLKTFALALSAPGGSVFILH